jgi:hypothetical protein
MAGGIAGDGLVVPGQQTREVAASGNLAAASASRFRCSAQVGQECLVLRFTAEDAVAMALV